MTSRNNIYIFTYFILVTFGASIIKCLLSKNALKNDDQSNSAIITMNNNNNSNNKQ